MQYQAVCSNLAKISRDSLYIGLFGQIQVRQRSWYRIASQAAYRKETGQLAHANLDSIAGTGQ